MKNRLVLKLFLILLLTVGVVVVAMMLLMRWSFDRGFTDYVNQLDQAAMIQTAERLETWYAETGGWLALRQNPRLWRALINGREPNTPPVERRSRSPHRHSGLAIGPRLTLFDPERRRIIGRDTAASSLNLQPLRHQGEIVGWLGLRPLKAPSAEPDVAFFQRQSQSIYVIGAVTFLVAGLAAIFLARRLLVPVRALATGAHALTGGDFSARVPVTSRDELGRLAEDFNRLAETLAATELSRRRWIADISHELRTPLAILLGEIEAVQDGVRQLDQETLESLHNEAQRLGKLVDDLYQIALSDLGALDYHKSEIDPVPLLSRVVENYRGRYADAGLDLVFEHDGQPLKLFADRERLAQLLHNLLENSLRYTDSGGHVRVRIHSVSANVTLDVEDSAPGPSAEALPHLFEHLYREDPSRNRTRGGAGLGLSIVRNIVEAHGGTVEARRSALGGLWVRVELPSAGESNR